MERLRKMNKIAKALGYILYSFGGGGYYHIMGWDIVG